jgi:hypothetical protein
MKDLHPKLKQHARLLAALITAAVLLSVCVPAPDASPGMGRQTPPSEGDIDDCPFCTDHGSGGDDVANALGSAPQHGRAEGEESGQDLLNPGQTGAQATAAIC